MQRVLHRAQAEQPGRSATSSNTAGIPVLARPFIDIAGGARAGDPVRPELRGRRACGSKHRPPDVSASSRSGCGTCTGPNRGASGCWSVDFLAGYKFLQVRENLIIDSFTQFDTAIALPIFAGRAVRSVAPDHGHRAGPGALGGVIVGGPAVVQIRDQFRVTNRFNGGVIGLEVEGRYGMFTSSLPPRPRSATCTSGWRSSGPARSSIPACSPARRPPSGSPRASAATAGRWAACWPTRATSARSCNDRFTVIPEVGGTSGIALTRGLTGYIGVNFIYIPDVIRPGEAVNPFDQQRRRSRSARTSGRPASRAARPSFNEDRPLGGRCDLRLPAPLLIADAESGTRDEDRERMARCLRSAFRV